jgi:glucosamine--fructose-6-phosphate aminotransferase (isomerizing)
MDIGIGHTLGNTWCANDVNSHPHISNSGDLAIVHNGIIENYAPLKAELTKEAMFFTQTQILKF